MNANNLLADRTQNMGANVIREILKVVSQPGMISLAGGIPSPESFPMQILNDLTAKVFEKYASTAFQYDLTEGFMPLRAALTDYLGDKGIHVAADDVLITSGSQGVLDALGKVLISKGDCVAVEAPTYLGAIQAFNPYRPRYVRIEMDEEGVIPESLEKVLTSHPVKFIYLVPTFQNPTGRSLSLERRRQIARIIERHQALLIEDDPYSALRYQGEELPPIKSLAPDHVVYVGTFSKVLAPGLRIGFVAAPAALAKWLVYVKQGTDLHTGTFGQALAAEYLAGGHLKQHLPRIIDLYRPRQQAMLHALESYFPDGFRWSRPEGGMFIWVEGPPGLDMEKVYWQSVQKKAAFVPGKFFFAHDGEGIETMRLNFTMSDEETIDRAVKIIAGVIEEEILRSKPNKSS